MSLREARLAVEKNWREAKAGRDPRGGVPTFEGATKRVIKLHREGWKAGSRTEANWRNSFRTHLYPKIGAKRIDKITTADLSSVLVPLVHSKPVQADILRRRVGQVLRWAVGQGYRPDNPAGPALAAVLPKSKNGRKGHHAALPHDEVAAALAKIEKSGTGPAVRWALRFLVQTACRTSEVLGAEWSEIDLEAKVWTIPATRMKAGKGHRVPLSRGALEVLEDAGRRWGSEGLVFPSKGGKQIGGSSFRAVFQRLEIEATPHGMRSSFRDWCGETGVSPEVANACLAHVVRGVEGAYARSDLLERRRPIMERWGEYISS